MAKLKTYVMNSGFFEQAVAAPSMKAAIDAFGTVSDIFKKGFAKQTSNTDIVKATTAMPGVVLKRPVGTKGAFTEHAELPKFKGMPKAIGKVKKEKVRNVKAEEKIRATVETAATRHQKNLDKLILQQSQLQQLVEKEMERWEHEKQSLQLRLEKTRRSR